MLFGCLTMLIVIINIAAWVVWVCFSFAIDTGPGFAALIGALGYALSWGIVDGSIMSPAMYFFNPALHIVLMKAGFCNAVGIGLCALAAHFLY